MTPPTGTFNFVRVHGETPHNRPLLISAKLAHAQMAGGRPVVYAGTARFDRGEMAWWSNFSGTYQPIAAFRAQAGLPDDKFVPWQKLQMGGTAMQRGIFTERRPAGRPAALAGMSDDGITNGSPICSGAAKQPAASMAGAAATASGAAAAKPKAASPGGAKSSAPAPRPRQNRDRQEARHDGKGDPRVVFGRSAKIAAANSGATAAADPGKDSGAAAGSADAGLWACGRPPGPPAPAFAARNGAVQRHGSGGAFAVEAGQVGLSSGAGGRCLMRCAARWRPPSAPIFPMCGCMSGRRPSASARSPSPSAPKSISRPAAISPTRCTASNCSAMNWRMSCSSAPAGCATRSDQGSPWFRITPSKPKPTASASAPPPTGSQLSRNCRRAPRNLRHRCEFPRRSMPAPAVTA